MNIKIGRYVVELTNEQRPLFGKNGSTKGDLIAYYRDVAPVMLPHVKNRLITLQRFPHGIDQEGFFQKDAAAYFPSWVARCAVEKKEGGFVNYVVIKNTATIVYLANQACITLHAGLSRIDKLEYPDRIIFDLDPSGKDFYQVQKAALQLRDIIESIGLTPFVMTTGSRGLHVVVPITRTYNFDTVRAFAKDIAQVIVQQNPQHLTVVFSKKARKGKIFVDILRNACGQTGVAPYSVRPISGAPVATPISWSELPNKNLISQQYTMATITKRLAQHGDPWKDIHVHAGSVRTARAKFKKLYGHELKSE